MTPNILVPMDSSEPAEKALKYALNGYPEAHITVLHVLDVSTISRQSGLAFDDSVQQRLEEESNEIFSRAKEIADSAGFTGTISTERGVGSPARSIIDHSEEMDEIVIGSQGKHGVERILLGSVAETVVRRASIPVTVVR